ncbi:MULTISPECIES: hypothetical protein [Bacillus cereus group]|uniref:hypothetical protein n=1 Tax=Bacillus cereus group TaxID=86661 RepID=UPI0035A2FB8D
MPCKPCEPVGPVGPVGPPADPGGPVGPIGPVGPDSGIGKAHGNGINLPFLKQSIFSTPHNSSILHPTIYEIAYKELKNNQSKHTNTS